MATHQGVKATGKPKAIKIGNRLVQLVEADEIESSNGRLLGMYSPSKGAILVEKGLQPAHKAEVILHEIMHAVNNDFFGLAPSDANHVEEFYVNNAALGVVKVFRDNPQFFRWWSYLMSAEHNG